MPSAGLWKNTSWKSCASRKRWRRGDETVRNELCKGPLLVVWQFYIDLNSPGPAFIRKKLGMVRSCHPEALLLREGSREMRRMKMPSLNPRQMLPPSNGRRAEQRQLQCETSRKILSAKEALQDDRA